MSAGHAAYPNLAREFEAPFGAPIATTKAPVPVGRITPGEAVLVEGRTGTWRVVAFTREGAQLESLRSLTRTVIAGVSYDRLRRVNR